MQAAVIAPAEPELDPDSDDSNSSPPPKKSFCCGLCCQQGDKPYREALGALQYLRHTTQFHNSLDSLTIPVLLIGMLYNVYLPISNLRGIIG